MDELGESCPFIPLCKILKATNNFDEALVIGTGGFVKVYKAIIEDGATTTVAAMKRLNAKSNHGAEEFWTVVKLVSKFHHTNLVSLIGYCNENQEMVLVYNYITLASHLYKSSKEECGGSRSHLTWEGRLNICLGAARGLDHLHTGTEQRIVHRDVKSTNILLDENWVAKVSDFGIGELITSQITTHVRTKVKAMRVYLDPIYFSTGRFIQKSDVYSFGVVLLEVLCGRPPLDERLDEEQRSLISWAKYHVEHGELDQIIDPSLNGETTAQSLMDFAKLAINCLHIKPKERPTMSEVVEILQNALAGAFSKQLPFSNKQNPIDYSPSSGHANDSPQESDSKTCTKLYRQLSLANIRVATKDFNKSFLVRNSDKVYKGSIFIDGKARVATIKRCKKLEADGNDIRPKKLLSHPYILSPIGVCTEGDELILVHEYMPNGSLRDYLLHTPLPWETRLQICIGAAQALEYLYANGERELIHRCIEPSNILLDRHWVAKVMLYNTSTKTNISAGLLRSTLMRYNSVYQEDVMYSFSVTLLEVLISDERLGNFLDKRKQLGFNQDHEYPDLPLMYYLDEVVLTNNINKVMDERLVGKIGPESLRKFVRISLSCLSQQGLQRPSIDNVVRSLQSALHLQQNWESLITWPRYTLYHSTDRCYHPIRGQIQPYAVEPIPAEGANIDIAANNDLFLLHYVKGSKITYSTTQ